MASTFSRPILTVAMIVMAGLAGCARPVGDFGTAVDDPVHDGVVYSANALRELGRPDSWVNLTDEEREMRARIWRYLVAPEDYDWFGDSLTELSQLGFSKSHPHMPSTSAYYRWLHGTTFSSSRTRYARLDDDIRSDLATMPAVFAAICASQEIDRRRSIAIGSVASIERSIQNAAAAQMAENKAVVDWFVQALEARYSSYSFALNHLLVDTPHEQAIEVDSDLSSLNIEADRAANGDFCVETRRSVRASLSFAEPGQARGRDGG